MFYSCSVIGSFAARVWMWDESIAPRTGARIIVACHYFAIILHGSAWSHKPIYYSDSTLFPPPPSPIHELNDHGYDYYPGYDFEQ